jgi:hypothetical protein
MVVLVASRSLKLDSKFIDFDEYFWALPRMARLHCLRSQCTAWCSGSMQPVSCFFLLCGTDRAGVVLLMNCLFLVRCSTLRS